MFTKILIANRGEIACRVVIALLALLSGAKANVDSSSVPFIGCRSDGQQGPIPAPRSQHRVEVQFDAHTAQQLAFYRAKFSPGVLARREWQCAGLLGSDDEFLLVAPHLPPLKSFSTAYHHLTTAAVVAEHMFGGTSGRFGVADVLARFFPHQRTFVRALQLGDVSHTFHPVYHPYDADRLSRKADRLVEFVTPTFANCIGTTWWLRENGMPVRGALIIERGGKELYLATVRVRMPDRLVDLAKPIISRFEESAKDRNDG